MLSLEALFERFFADRGYVSKKLANQLPKEFGIDFLRNLTMI